MQFNCSNTTIVNRFIRTINRLVDYYDFDNLKIDYPCEKRNIRCDTSFNNARNHADYWMKVISDYENGVKSYKRNFPIPLYDTMKITELTVQEFKELMSHILSK